MLGFVGLYSLFYKDYCGYNEYNQRSRLGIEIGSNHANLSYFRYQKWNYILSLIKQKQVKTILKNRQIAVITITSVAIMLTLSTVYANFDILQAYANDTLSSDNVAKSIQIRVTPSGTILEQTYNSFSRVGFVDGENNFLLESVPSKDKKQYYELVKRSIEDQSEGITNKRMHVSIDLFAGDGEIIQSLEYRDCKVTEYFVHGVDSKGKIFFTEEDGTVEIREVTKFSCVSFTLNFEPRNTSLHIDKIIDEITDENSNKTQYDHLDDAPFHSNQPQSDSKEGDLFFNSMTNTLQKFINGEWIDISGKGGPPSPRR